MTVWNFIDIHPMLSIGMLCIISATLTDIFETFSKNRDKQNDKN